MPRAVLEFGGGLEPLIEPEQVGQEFFRRGKRQLKFVRASRPAFTLAEMMVVMLIVSIVLAAMAPVITTKMKRDNAKELSSSIWRWTDSYDAIYFKADGGKQPVLVGQNAIYGDEPLSLLVLNSDSISNHILFKNGDEVLGRLFMRNANVILGDVNEPPNYTEESVAIGSGVSYERSESVTIGYNAQSNGNQSVSIGKEAKISIPNEHEDKQGSVAIGYKAEVTRADSIAIGKEVKATNGSSIAIGSPGYYGSMIYTEASGADSIAMGDATQAQGSNSIALGTHALSEDSNSIAIGTHTKSGGNSIAIGYYALSDNTTGYNNVAIGALALTRNTSGSTNIAIGDALGSNTVGSRNIAIGSYALGSNSTGSGNIAIGKNACENILGSNKICIGANSGPEASSPWAKTTDIEERIFIGSKSNANNGSAVLEIHNVPGEHNLTTTFNNDAGMRSNSAVVINAPLIVNGPIYLRAAENHDYTVNWAYLYSSNFINSSRERTMLARSGDSHPLIPSDRRLKYVGKENKDGLNKLRQLKVFNYTFKKDPSKEPRVGVIAQDLQKVFPNAVKKGSDGFLTIRMEDMFYAVVNAVKELDMKVTEILKRVQNDEREIQNTKKEIEALKKENKELKQALQQVQKDLKELKFHTK